jgi:predicted RNA-binding protein YlxR (DUF448 family)
LTRALAESDDADRRGPGRTRMCAVERRVAPESELIRFVAAPDGGVVADLKARLPGRGIWVGLDRKLVGEAARKNVFARGLKKPVAPAADLADQVAARLKEAALGRLGLARKAGAVLAGFAKVEAAIAREELAGLLIASDAAEDGRRRMEQALFRRYGNASKVPLLRLFGAEELSLAMGRPHVIHAAVLHSPAGRSFVDAAIRLQRYEGVGDGRVNDKADVPQDVTNE